MIRKSTFGKLQNIYIDEIHKRVIQSIPSKQVDLINPILGVSFHEYNQSVIIDDFFIGYIEIWSIIDGELLLIEDDEIIENYTSGSFAILNMGKGIHCKMKFSNGFRGIKFEINLTREAKKKQNSINKQYSNEGNINETHFSYKVLLGNYHIDDFEHHFPLLLNIKLQSGATKNIKLKEGVESLIYVVSGKVLINGLKANAFDLIPFEKENNLIQVYAYQDAEIFLLAVNELNEPIAQYAHMCLNTQSEIISMIKALNKG